MKVKNKISIVLILLVMMSMLVGCSSQNKSTAAPITEAASTTPPTVPEVSVTESPASEGTEAPKTITLTDNVGREVELPYPVETCAVALRYTNELIRACGAIDKVIAVDLNTAQDRNYWGMFDPNEVIGKSQRELDYEKIISLNPQVLILPANGNYEEAIEDFNKAIELFLSSIFCVFSLNSLTVK